MNANDVERVEDGRRDGPDAGADKELSSNRSVRYAQPLLGREVDGARWTVSHQDRGEASVTFGRAVLTNYLEEGVHGVFEAVVVLRVLHQRLKSNQFVVDYTQ